jgi:hypothetical protein
MTSKIKVDNINKVSDDSNIIKKCGTTTTIGSGASNPIVVDGSAITLGRCGGTVALASGATQTGFGRTGTVNWVTTKKTTGFTAVSGNGYFCDTAASGAFTLTLPSSPSAGDIVGMKDYNGNFATANLTIGRNGSPINGGSSVDVVISTSGASIFLVYVDATQGWVATQDDESVFTGEAFIVATGGTITEDGNDKIHTFTGPGDFIVSSIANCAANNLVSYVVVAGGGGGGSGAVSEGGGGGGAGGYRETKSPATPYTASPLCGHGTPGNRITVTAATFPIVVGGGGPGGTTAGNNSGSGSVSTFSTITSAGGGAAGGQTGTPSGRPGTAGGSGGGAVNGTGGAGNTPSTTPAQGNNAGGSGSGPIANSTYVGSGGGGATSVGLSTSSAPGKGSGGDGATSSINGTPTARAGGGGGGFGPAPSSPYGIGAGGAGGGGGGGPTTQTAGNAGIDNTGGGGGGGSSGSSPVVLGGQGGSGIVIIRYKFQ